MVKWTVGLAALLIFSGCGSNAKKVEQEKSNLKPLAVLYGQYQRQNQGRTPANEEAFKEYVAKEGAAILQQFEIPNVDALFISSRDNQPYVIVYGATGAVPGPPPPPGPPGAPGGPGSQSIIAYESMGVGGKRLIANSLGGISEVDEAKFKELVPSAK